MMRTAGAVAPDKDLGNIAASGKHNR